MSQKKGHEELEKPISVSIPPDLDLRIEQAVWEQKIRSVGSKVKPTKKSFIVKALQVAVGQEERLAKKRTVAKAGKDGR